MTQTVLERNPFMLMISPELVLAAVENSDRLRQLNRHLCRPLDRPSALTGEPAADDAAEAADALDSTEDDAED